MCTDDKPLLIISQDQKTAEQQIGEFLPSNLGWYYEKEVSKKCIKDFYTIEKKDYANPNIFMAHAISHAVYLAFCPNSFITEKQEIKARKHKTMIQLLEEISSIFRQIIKPIQFQMYIMKKVIFSFTTITGREITGSREYETIHCNVFQYCPFLEEIVKNYAYHIIVDNKPRTPPGDIQSCTITIEIDTIGNPYFIQYMKE